MSKPDPLQTYYAISCGTDDSGRIGYYAFPLTHPASGPLEAPPAGSQAFVLFSSRQLCQEYIARNKLSDVGMVVELGALECVHLLADAMKKGIYSHATLNPSVNVVTVQEIEPFLWSMAERTPENPGSM